MLELYTEVALTRDVPEDQLKAGDVAVLIDFIPHARGGEQGCILEVFNVVGRNDRSRYGSYFCHQVVTV